MVQELTQRWKDRRASYRARGEGFDPSEYGVEVIPKDKPARDFVCGHHYSGSYPAARYRVGLYRKAGGWFLSQLVGVAVYSVPVQQATIPRYVPGLTAAEGVELGRFVLLDEVPFNAETWFLAQAERMVREALGIKAIVSFSDPFPRKDQTGRVIMPGHVGTIYQARNALYCGLGSANWHYLTPSGRFLSKRGISKIRLQEQGWEGAANALIAEGAPQRNQGETPQAWVVRALAEGPFERVRHPGNHVYTWIFDKKIRAAAVAVAQSYPKKHDKPAQSAGVNDV